MRQASTPKTTFEVRLIGPDLAPEILTLRAVNDVLSAVQDLASGRDPFESRHVPLEKSISLSRVRSGSAVYACVSRAPDEARTNLARVGRILGLATSGGFDDEGLVGVLRPIESLSEVAKTIKGTIEVALTKAASPLFTIAHDAFNRISGRLLLSGDTTVVGQVLRAGGATRTKCMLRVPGRHRALYCNVATRKLAQRLGQHLYEEIAATGTATWIHRTWRIYRFTIKDFSQPQLGNAREALEQLRTAGPSAWDSIPDPAEYVQELRS
jgi:hypothetical protein